LDLAIFWLPLIAGILLSGLAVGAWYGGNKTFAVWVGFVGVICLVLTAALQLQQYVWRETNQPKITLQSTEQRSVLRFDPPRSYQMQISNSPTPEYGVWKVPSLIIRNSGTFAQDATMKWGVAPYEVQALIDASPRLKAHQVIMNDTKNQMTIRPRAGVQGAPGFVHPLEWSVSVPLPFITRETRTIIPLPIWEHAALFFIATLPDDPGAKSEPFFFDAQIKWNIPEGGQPKQFRISAVAFNAKPVGVTTPEVLANIEFAIAEAD
jgi:hypothetical protein